MPNYYAHLEYGRRVLELLPPALRWTVEREKDAFEVGLYGPDPLYFYHPMTNNVVRKTGSVAHRQAARKPMERLRQAAAVSAPMALGYAAGFLCHYALDSACHPIVEAEAARGMLTHGAIESEFDRRLMEQKFLDPLHDTPMPEHELPEAVFAAGACAYTSVSPRQYRAGLELFQKVSRLLTLAGGTPIRRFADRLAVRHSSLSSLRGVVLQAEPDPACGAVCALLEETFQASMSTAAEQLALFLECPRGAPLSEWLDRDFSGRIPREEKAAAPELLPKAAGATG